MLEHTALCNLLLRLPEALRSQIDEIAAADGEPRSVVIRKLLRAGLKVAREER